jgi:transposase
MIMGLEKVNVGAEIVKQLIALDCSVYRIAKEFQVSYCTAKAWKRGWWNPSLMNTYKLESLKCRIMAEFKGVV